LVAFGLNLNSAAGTRMLQLISFKEEGFFITFTSPAMDSDFMIDLELVGVVKINCFKLL
jgi:hypothetical protein